MAFTYTINDNICHGINFSEYTGTYTNDGGSTGGKITLPVSQITSFCLQPKASSVSANQPVYNNTLPSAVPEITIVTSANEVGYWIAKCR